MSEEVQYLSLADLEQMQGEEMVGFDANADANAGIPPIPHGKYLVKVKHRAEDPQKFWAAKKTSTASKTPGIPYFATELACEIVENPVNPSNLYGRKFVLFDRDMRTLPSPQGTSEVQALIQGLGKGHEAANGPQTGNRYAAILTRELASEPLVGVELDVEGSFYDKEAQEETHPRVRGQSKFPKDDKGNVVYKITKEGMEAQVRNFVRRWIPVAELTGGAAGLHAVSSQGSQTSTASTSASEEMQASAPTGAVRRKKA